MANGILHHGFCRIERLDKHAASAIGAPRAARRLAQQLIQAFRRTEIRDSKARISADNSHKFYTRKIMALRNHLRTKQNIIFTLPERCQYFFDSAHVLRRIAIHANHLCIRHPFMDFFFELFNRATNKFISFRTTCRARRINMIQCCTVMTHQRIVLLMIN